jgi:hypothetical protein
MMTIASTYLATIYAQLGQLSEEKLRDIMSYQASISSIASTPTAVSSSTPVHAHAHASHRPLPNSSAGGSLSAMASSRRHSAITDHLRRNAQSHYTTPCCTFRRAIITPRNFTVFRPQPPSPTPISIRSHNDIEVRTPAPPPIRACSPLVPCIARSHGCHGTLLRYHTSLWRHGPICTTSPQWWLASPGPNTIGGSLLHHKVSGTSCHEALPG